MKTSRSAAVAVMVGYVLGRRKKFRTATLMAAAAAVGGTTVGGIAMKRGMKMLSNSDALGKIAPQLSEITDTVRGDLLTAAKGAASAAVTNRVDSLTDSLHDRAERLRNPGEAVAEGAGEAAEAGRAAAGSGRRAAGSAGRTAGRAGGRAASTAGGTASRVTGRGSSRDEDEYEADDYEGDEYEPEEPEGDEYEADEDVRAGGRGDEADEAEAGAAPPRRGTARRRSPVTRAGR